jgi:hypothetical protein
LSAVDEFVVTYQCHTGENSAEELGDDIAHLAASHRDLEEALSELVTEGGLNPLVVETIMRRARRDWPLPGLQRNLDSVECINCSVRTIHPL